MPSQRCTERSVSGVSLIIKYIICWLAILQLLAFFQSVLSSKSIKNGSALKYILLNKIFTRSKKKQPKAIFI